MRLLPQTHAVRICADTRTLRTTRGNLQYDQLVLAHGAQAALPPALPAACVWRVNHLGAYQKLRAALGNGEASGPKDVLIVGAGLIGSELANDLALAGHRITLLDTQGEPLARWQSDHAGSQLLGAWKDLPIRFIGGVQVACVERNVDRIEGRDEVRFCVTTTDGQTFVVDQVVAATGLATPSRLAQSAGLDWNQGIAVQAATLRQELGGFLLSLGGMHASSAFQTRPRPHDAPDLASGRPHSLCFVHESAICDRDEWSRGGKRAANAEIGPDVLVTTPSPFGPQGLESEPRGEVGLTGAFASSTHPILALKPEAAAAPARVPLIGIVPLL